METHRLCVLYQTEFKRFFFYSRGTDGSDTELLNLLAFAFHAPVVQSVRGEGMEKSANGFPRWHHSDGSYD